MLIAERRTRLQIAILSDTHGLLRPAVLAELEAVDHILHAGDLGSEAVLRTLQELAPLTAIRGNVDTEPPLSALPATEMVQLGGLTFYLVHAIADLDLDPVAAGVDIVVYGHSHQPAQERRNGVLYLNPGSVGPRRFRLPISMAMATIQNGSLEIKMKTFPAS